MGLNDASLDRNRTIVYFLWGRGLGLGDLWESLFVRKRERRNCYNPVYIHSFLALQGDMSRSCSGFIATMRKKPENHRNNPDITYLLNPHQCLPPPEVLLDRKVCLSEFSPHWMMQPNACLTDTSSKESISCYNSTNQLFILVPYC